MRKIIGAIVAASLTFSLLPAYAQQNDTVSGPATQVDSQQLVIEARNAYPTSVEIKAPAGTNVTINNLKNLRNVASIAATTGEWQTVTYPTQEVGAKLFAADVAQLAKSAEITVVAAPVKPTTTTPTATKTTTPTPTNTTSSKAASTSTSKAPATSEPKPKQTSAATTTSQAPKPTPGVTPDKTAGHSTASFIGSIIAVIVAAVGILAAVFQKQLLSLVRR